MNGQKPEALRLADELYEAAEDYYLFDKDTGYGAAAELRRLHEVNAELLEACQLIVSAFDALKPGSAARNEPLQINAARAAIAKATGEQQ